MVITIIGTGYVGLVTGAVFADFGHTVHCIDIDQAKIEALKRNEMPFYEPGLKELVKRNFDQKRLFFTTDYATAIPKSKAVFVCVGTPPLPNGEANLTYLESAIEETAKNLKNFTLIVIKSTVPVGTEKKLQYLISKHTASKYEFASCPEFLKEGSAVEDATSPDRIIIGTHSKSAQNLLLDIYKSFPGERLICDLTSAQLIKYASNSLLATKISFANAIANISELLQADAETVLKGVGLDQRIGPHFLKPGVGYGGSCFPKDISAFIALSKDAGYSFDLLTAVEDINNQQIDHFLAKISQAVGPFSNKTITVLGLAFKPNTDDVREAPSIKIIRKLLAAGAQINAYDPLATETARQVLKDSITYSTSPYTAAKDSHALLILTEWHEFQELDLKKIKSLMKKPLIIDGRNIYDPAKTTAMGFKYIGIGKTS